VRSLVGGLVERFDMPTVVDMEAGLEHLSRGTVRHVDTLLTVIEPYFKSMETAARMTELGHELGLSRVYAVANKVRSDEDQQALQQFCEQRGLQLIASVPEDEAIKKADRLGVAPLDDNPSGAAVQAIDSLARELSGNA
jgi:CO dehydrogenase maturation factor